jgi:ubiquinol-cytochrome c reductase cytochrome b subunit
MSWINQKSNLSNVSKGIAKSSLLFINKVKGLLPLNLPRVNKKYLFDLLDSHLIHYASPITLTYAWSFGALAGICLVIQIISGIFLAMHYTPHIDLAFSSVEYIMRDVKNGWLVRYIHANGASMFFIVVYVHIGRGLYYGSYMAPRQFLWCSGVIILLLMMGTAFTGYVLPWGQMSFWGATVITNMVTAIPVAGKHIVQWLWGGYTVSNPTLNRFYSIHFVLPFLIAGLTLIHLALLHKEGSNNPIGSDTGIDDIPFYPYFVSKDVFAFSCFLVFFATFVFYFPNTLNHPDNYIPADPLETPAHVVPEWYFLAYYAILRSIPHKAGGIAAMGGAILVLLAIPFINTSEVRNTTYRPIFKFCFWFFLADFVILTWVGQKPVRDSFILLGQVATFYYFIFFLVLIPLVGIIECVPFCLFYRCIICLLYTTLFFMVGSTIKVTV